jgi:hypothetical protein
MLLDFDFGRVHTHTHTYTALEVPLGGKTEAEVKMRLGR